MEIEVKKANAEETPASRMAEFATEHITALMTLGGIESIGAQRYTCGFGTRLHVSFSTFKGAPDEVVKQGIVIKDAIAQIMSVANLVQITIKPSEEDMVQMREAWGDSAPQGGSADAESKAEDAKEKTDENVG